MLSIVLFALTATASEITVSATKPVIIAIDGQATGVSGVRTDTPDLEAGPHTVEIRNLVGSIQAVATVQLGPDERLRLLYDGQAKVLRELERVKLGGSEPVPTAVAAPPPAPKPAALALPDSKTGSLGITGVSDITGTVDVNDTALGFDADRHAFVAVGLPAGPVTVRVQDAGKLRTEAPLAVVAGGHQECQLEYRRTAWMLDCAVTGPELREEAP